MFEPADTQECYDYTVAAFELADRFRSPVLLRLTTRVCHSKCVFVRNHAAEAPRQGSYSKDSGANVMVPANARKAHRRLRADLHAMRQENEKYSIRSNELFFSELSTKTDIIYDGKNFIKPFLNSLSKANQSIVLACPKIKPGRYSAIANRLCELAATGIAIHIFTKEENDDVTKFRVNGINVNLRPDINFNCCIIDKKGIWYGSVNFLGYHSTEDNVITFHDAETAKDILALLCK